jgi:predicted CoA-binding protein
MPQTVAILGATPKEDRFANRAMRMLLSHGHRVIPVNPAFQEVLAHPCKASIAAIDEPIDTVTMYIGPARSEPLIAEIIAAKPRRIIFNPGAENPNLAKAASAAGIEVVEGCTLVMLQSGTF